MANFEQAYDKMMEDEGGYVLHEVKGDRGGQTYAGIARKMHPNWEGWQHIDYQETPPTQLVRDFYKTNFWDKIKGDDLTHDVIASSIFNFAVNAGVPVSIKLAQICVKTAPDGVIGAKTVSALNQANPELFVANLTIFLGLAVPSPLSSFNSRNFSGGNGYFSPLGPVMM